MRDACQLDLAWCCVQLLSHVQLFATPWTAALQAPLSMGFSRQEYWSGLPCPPLGDLPSPGIVPRSPALQVDSLPTEPPGKPRSGLRPLLTTELLGGIHRPASFTHFWDQVTLQANPISICGVGLGQLWFSSFSGDLHMEPGENHCFGPCAAPTAVLGAAAAAPGSWVERQNLGPTPDLLNQNLHLNKIPV